MLTIFTAELWDELHFFFVLFLIFIFSMVIESYFVIKKKMYAINENLCLYITLALSNLEA